MPNARITFSAGDKVQVTHRDDGTREFADRLASSDTYVYVDKKDGGSIFVNGRTVAYVEDWPE